MNSFSRVFFRYLMPSLFNQQKQNPKAILPWGTLDEITYRDSNYCLTFVLDNRTTLVWRPLFQQALNKRLSQPFQFTYA